MKYTRRDFLQTTAATGIASLAAGNLFSGTGSTSASDVFAGKGAANDVLPKILKKMGGIEQFVKKGSRVLLKPNMSFPNPPSWGTTTSPEAVYAIAKLCLDAGAKRVIICDNVLHDPESCKQKTGIPAAVKDLKGAVIYVPKQPSAFVTKTDGRAKELTTVDIVKELFQSDCFISISAAKSHAAGVVSFNIKGLMGLVKDRDVYHREMDLHNAVADQLYYMKPHLNIVDASFALLDNGPAGPGTVAELKTLAASVDPVAVDAFATSLASWNGRKLDGSQVPHLKKAAELGFGNTESSKIRITTV